MRLLMDHPSHSIGAGQSYPPTRQQTSLISSPGKFWEEWQIQCLILVSFGLQVFLFLAAGMRRRSASRVLGSLLWLAYLSADSVAIFVLGHLALHANGPQHQLLFFWAPFVLLHLGGQDTLTAFSMQDNDLWKRHLLGLVTQVAAAGYVISRTSWPDRRLLAAMVLMFLSGCYKYAERTICLYRASPTRLMESSLVSLNRYAVFKASPTRLSRLPWGSWKRYVAQMVRGSPGFYKERFREIVKANGWRQSSQTFWNLAGFFLSSGISLVSDTPINDFDTINVRNQDIESLLEGLKSNEDRCRVYNYVSIRPILLYERLYTKKPLRFSYIDGLTIITQFFGEPCSLCVGLFASLVSALLLFFPFLSTSTALVLFFKVVQKGQLYSRVDVIVSYILLTGAIVLEVASLFVSILSYVDCRDIFQNGRKQWSEMLGQYNMARSLTRRILIFPRRWIDNTSHIPVSGNLKKFVLDKLCDLGTREQDWNFASFHGKLALRKWMDTHKDSVYARQETPLNLIINDLDLPTSVLILHIATDILYILEEQSINSDHQTMRKISRELSNYIMYLVFQCGAMLTSRTKLLHEKALEEMENIVNKYINLGEEDAIKKVFAACKGPRSLSEQAAQMLHLKDTFTALTSPLLSRATDVAQELIDIHRKADCWDLVAAVWVEMLYYIAPRCGGAFHSHHLSTGGEFITHVLILMQLLGPFLPPPSA